MSYHCVNARPASLLAALGTCAFIASTAWAGDIVVTLEEPTANSAYSGVANIRGWVVGSVGIDRIELYVDDELKTNIPVGGRRSEVGAEYPNYPNSANSGFSMAYNYSNLTAGQHTIRVSAIDQEGAVEDASATFNVTRFDNPYIADPAQINLNGATVSHDGGRSIFISNMTAEGKSYDLRLDWRTETQGYAITQITPIGGQIQDFSGAYQYNGSLTSNSCANQLPPTISSSLRLSQNNTQLSGSAGTLSIAGTVDAQGNFSMTTPVQEEDIPNSPCKSQLYLAQQGNFISGTGAISINYRTIGNDPACASECSAKYDGTIQATGNATTTNTNSVDSGLSRSAESDLQKLLDSVKY